MPSSTTFSLVSGEGSGDITGSTPQLIIAVRAAVISITSPRVRPSGTQSPRRLQYAGSFGLWYPADEEGNIPAGNTVVWSDHMQFEDQYLYIAPLDKYARYFFWILPPGVEAEFVVAW